eukprot:TRINITY_DN22560_c0_g2_i1.p1 TRINITY_DN22560_c0_g2~~TRINITY_DN22560_c0_g2_i1.p1  ORF type:complete len:488 (-),score=56.07 TRINITY_DN22560_c0_g2_i1:3-1466(-)
MAVLAASRRIARRFLAVSSPGLERCLERELQALKVPGRLQVVPGGVAIDGTLESLWRCVLQSRVAESVQLRLGDGFHAPTLTCLEAGLERLPWEDCLRLQDEPCSTPLVKATSMKSRLFHTRMIEQRVAVAVDEARYQRKKTPSVACDDNGDAVAESGTQTGRTSVGKAIAPTIHVQLRHDECHVSIGASGLLHQRGYRKAVGDAPLRETLAAACVMSSSFMQRLTAATYSGEEVVLWDPFCGSGTMILEALAIALGQPPGDHTKAYPFKTFPCHDNELYQDVVANVPVHRHAALSRLELLGSDMSADQIDRANRNLHRFVRRIHPAADDGAQSDMDRHLTQNGSMGGMGNSESGKVESQLPCRVMFVHGNAMKVLPSLAGRPTTILTNVPYGILSGSNSNEKTGQSEAIDTYAQLGRFLRQCQADWRGVFCLVADTDSFKQHTGLEWTTELSFRSGGIRVSLMQWTGRSQDDRGSARDRSKLRTRR